MLSSGKCGGRSGLFAALYDVDPDYVMMEFVEGTPAAAKIHEPNYDERESHICSIREVRLLLAEKRRLKLDQTHRGLCYNLLNKHSGGELRPWRSTSL